MAAYAALVSLEQTIVHILNSDSYALFLRQKGQIASIHKYLIFLQAFLQDFPEKSNSSLEERMRDIVIQAQDTIQYLMYKYNRPIIKTLAQLIVEIDSVALEVNMRIQNSLTIKDLRLGDDDDSPPPAAAASSSPRLAGSREKDPMIGFDDNLLAIKERLCGQSSKLQVIPVVGMGGIGKTTLTLNVYNDPLIIEHFHIRAWATVSQDYSAQKVLSELLVSMKQFDTGRSGQSNEVDVYQRLKRRRYLIVMDDIWSTKAWDDVKRVFPDDHNGSRILLTTRITDVAVYADSSGHLHQMRLMDRNQSWDLLREKVFKQQVCPLELKDIGKEIAGSCRGLPLAIVVIAGLLSTVSKTPTSWEDIAKNVKSAIAMNDEQFEKIFSLSYKHLPHHLKACFLYLGAFPEDYNINISKLVKLWVAEGFIKPSESKNLEEMAEEYLEDLVKRFLVLVSEKKWNGKIKSCRLHDVIRELCKRRAEQEKFLLYVRDTSNLHEESTKNQWRLSINQSDDLSCLAKFYGSTIRTLMCFVSGENPNIYSKHFRFLRVSHFEYLYDFGFQHRPLDEVFESFHLRYLAFGCMEFVFIPATITDLQHLQTLIINKKSMSDKVILPSGIWRMRQLRHLVCYRIAELPNPEEGVTCGLENLQTLLQVRNFKCSESIMRMIPGVKKLGIVYRAKDFVGDEEYELENLVHLQHLEKLKIIVDGYALEKNVNLAFPRTLKKLRLEGYALRWDKDMMKIVGSLPNLQVLKLGFSHPDWNQWETSEGEFPELKYLLIHNSKLEEWISESSHFPSLIRLQLHYCPRLFEIPDDIGDIPTLELVQLSECRKSLAEFAKRIQEEQQNYGNDTFQVDCMNCIFL